MNAIPDLAVQFEAADDYAVSAPPPVAPRTPAPKRAPSGDESPACTPPLKSSPESSATTLSEHGVARTSTRRSTKSLPPPATQSTPPPRVGAPLSFVYGLLLGVLPLLIVIRFFVNRFRVRGDDARGLQERWFKYGRSTGLLLFVAIVIVVLVRLT